MHNMQIILLVEVLAFSSPRQSKFQSKRSLWLQKKMRTNRRGSRKITLNMPRRRPTFQATGYYLWANMTAMMKMISEGLEQYYHRIKYDILSFRFLCHLCSSHSFWFPFSICMFFPAQQSFLPLPSYYPDYVTCFKAFQNACNAFANAVKHASGKKDNYLYLAKTQTCLFKHGDT